MTIRIRIIPVTSLGRQACVNFLNIIIVSVVVRLIFGHVTVNGLNMLIGEDMGRVGLCRTWTIVRAVHAVGWIPFRELLEIVCGDFVEFFVVGSGILEPDLEKEHQKFN